MIILDKENKVYFARYVVKNEPLDMEIPFIEVADAEKYAVKVGGNVQVFDVPSEHLWLEGRYFSDTDEAKEALKLGPEAYERTRRRTSQELISVLGTDLVKERLARMQVEKQLKVLGQSVVALRVANMQGGKA